MNCLPEEAIAEGLASLPEWSREGDAIRRELELPSFAKALALAVEIGCLAERADHHPDLHLQYRRLAVVLTTHAAGGLTERDFRLAKRIDRAIVAATTG